MSSPIADLSYRNYDGPLQPPISRWLPIAKMSIRAAFKKKSFWVLTMLSGSWYVILMIIFYFVDLQASAISGATGQGIQNADAASKAIFARVDWNELFLHAFSRGQLWFFLLALLIGIGQIANDNRANALLVYLSKPCTKVDYLIGKWMGIFIPVAIATAIPTLFFYAYCFMSYRSVGFLHDPWLILKLFVLILVPAFFHASVALGISSMFKQGRLAGATYAGIFFFSYFFTTAMGVIHMQLSRGQESGSRLVDNAYYFSVDGLQIGLAKHILGRIGEQPFPAVGIRNGQMGGFFAVPAPNGLLISALYFGVCAIFLLIAYTRVRAVEVVG